MFLTLLYTLLAIVAAIYYIVKRKFNYWKNRNVPYVAPTSILGNYGDIILQKRHVSYVIDELCKKFPNEPYFGAFFGTEPALLVQDPELLKLITTKDFYYFNGRELSDHVEKELFNLNLFSSNGDKWRVVRQNLTPVFTSAKMKNMFPLIEKCSHELEKLIDADSLPGSIEVQVLIARFTMACISSCAFGIDSDTMGNEYKENPLTKIGKKFFSGTKFFAFKNNIRALWPSLFYALGIESVPPGLNDFFKKMVVEIFEARNYTPTGRNDFIDFILNFKKNSHIVGDSITNLKTGGNLKVKVPVDDDLLMAQCVVFFLAGFETSATTAGYTLLELAKNPETQKKVQEEIDRYLEKYDSKLTFDIVNELPYTWACVEETLRLYPVLVTITREVMEDYKLPTGLLLQKGTRIHIPVYTIHRNPKYHPEPEVYRPERFIGEEKRNIVPYSYFPFGEGARLCLGMRFAKMQTLAGLVTLLKKYIVQVDENTPLVPKFVPHYLVPAPETPLKLKVVRREGWETRQFC